MKFFSYFFPSSLNVNTLTELKNTLITSTVKPKIFTYHHNMNKEDLKFVQLLPTESEKRNVTHLNKMISIKISNINGNKGNVSNDNEDSHENDDEDGVLVTDEDEKEVENSTEDISLEKDSFEDEDEDYMEEDEDETSTTTTKKPFSRSKSTSKKPQRRMYSTTSERPKKQTQNSLSFSHFINFIKKIQDSFATRTAKTITDKIQILKKFRDSLIRSINRQIEGLWRFNKSPYSNKNKKSSNLRPEHRRKKKSHRIQKRTLSSHDEGWMEGGGMAFPSAEGALLSISFLTFAFFLIKLVLVNDNHQKHKTLFSLSFYLN
jgi:hypothetical protein